MTLSRVRAARPDLTGPTVVGLATTVLLGVLVAYFARWGPDWPAQEFRAWLGGRDSWAFYTTRWYSGDSVLGYSVLYPALAGVLGAATLGVFSCALATWAGCGLAPRSSRTRQTVFAVAVALSTVVNLLIGQVPFLLGAAFATLAVRLAVRQRSLQLVGIVALLASLASPLSGAFLLLCVPAFVVASGWRRASPLLLAGTGSVVAAAVGGAGGWFPCPWTALVGTLGFCAAIALLARPGRRPMLTFAACYAVAAVLVFVVPDPVGGNIARLAKLLALPLAAYWLRLRPGTVRRGGAVLLAAAAIVWPGEGLVSSVARGVDDPSSHASYYYGLTTYLRQHWNASGRLEVPFTREHWEAYFLARRFPLARGWDRQSDLEYNAVLYRHLTPAAYEHWLDVNAVTYVALPDAPLDFGGRAEANLLRDPPSYLHLVWHDADWRLWKVLDPGRLVTGPAVVTDNDPTTLTLTFTRPGSAVLRYRSTALWRSESSDACVSSTAQGWTRVTARRSGPVELGVGLLGSSSANCPAGSSLEP